MGSSEILDKYHRCSYIGNGDKFYEVKPSEICHSNAKRVLFYPKFDCIHAIPS